MSKQDVLTERQYIAALLCVHFMHFVQRRVRPHFPRDQRCDPWVKIRSRVTGVI